MNFSALLAQVRDPAKKDFQFWEPGSTFWMPPQASEGAASTDFVWNFILWVSIFFFVLICILMVYFMVRFRARTPDQAPVSHVKHNTPLELTWTIIPLILVVFMFYVGFRTYVRHLELAPQNAESITAIGLKWAWQFEYPNGHIDKDLHLKVNTPYRITLVSRDVTHSMFIPAFRVKKDAVPGRYNTVAFTPTKEGEFRLFCAEYCGTKHSDMMARVVVHDNAGYVKWMNEATDISDLPLYEQGRRVYQLKGGCVSCHSVDGSKMIGPSFAVQQPDGTLKSIFGKQEQFTDGSTLTVDEEYIRESIRYPGRKIVAGYQNQMSAYPETLLSDQEVRALIEYIKSLDPAYEPPPMPEADADGETETGGAAQDGGGDGSSETENGADDDGSDEAAPDAAPATQTAAAP